MCSMFEQFCYKSAHFFLLCDAELAGELCQADTEQWFFFTPRQEREARGGRPSRTTDSGYWKATGSPGYVYSSENRVIGVKKTMVFYKGKAPTGRKTKWKMNEYRAIEEEINPDSRAIPKVYITPINSLLGFFLQLPAQFPNIVSYSNIYFPVVEARIHFVPSVCDLGKLPCI